MHDRQKYNTTLSLALNARSIRQKAMKTTDLGTQLVRIRHLHRGAHVRIHLTKGISLVLPVEHRITCSLLHLDQISQILSTTSCRRLRMRKF